jgi:hypothetical protein
MQNEEFKFYKVSLVVVTCLHTQSSKRLNTTSYFDLIYRMVKYVTPRSSSKIGSLTLLPTGQTLLNSTLLMNAV